MMEPKEARIIYFDVLRIAATLAVVVLHLSVQHWADVDVSTRAWFAFNLYDSAARWAVPVFVMISGALFLGRDLPITELLRKNILRIAASFAFWSALYTLRGLSLAHITAQEILPTFFAGHYHMWFLYMIMGLYLLQPILRRIAADERIMRYFLLLSLLFTFILPQLSLLLGFVSPDASAVLDNILSRMSVFLPLGYTGYFVGGYYLSKCSIGKRTEAVIFAFGIVGLLFTVFATHSISVAQNAPYEKLYSYYAVGVLATAVAVFVFARRHLNFPTASDKTAHTLHTLSKYTFGAYLVHAMVIEVLGDRLGLNTLSTNAFFSVPLLAILVFVISMAISALLHQIPIVKKYLV